MSTYTGASRLIRLILRRDRIRLAVWISALAFTAIASAASIPPLYPDQRAIDDYARLFGDNPALVAFAGPGHGFDDPNLGVILVNETQLWMMIGAALMSIFLVNRHTRADEDGERADLVLANVTGRHAPVVAAVTVVGAANVVLAGVCGVAFVILGYEVVGSIALAASIAVAGLSFVAVSALAAQLASTGRATLGLASGVLGASFAIRAFGDISGGWLKWLSPIGWAQEVRAFAEERWWPLGLGILWCVVLLNTARALFDRRDLGSGILPQRPGRGYAPAWLASPLGLAVRLHRASALAWIAGTFLIGLVYGSIGDDVAEMVEDNPVFADILAQQGGADVTASFLATCISQLALLSAAFTIAAVLRSRTEESEGRAEQVLALPVRRTAWLRGHVVVAAVGAVLVTASGGLGVGTSYAVVTGDLFQIPRMVVSALVTLPAVWVFASVAVALFGSSPRRSLLAWAALAATVVTQYFGALLGFPEWVLAMSPLRHVPGLPAERFEAAPLLALTLSALAFVAIGFRSFGARNLSTD